LLRVSIFKEKNKVLTIQMMEKVGIRIVGLASNIPYNLAGAK